MEGLADFITTLITIGFVIAIISFIALVAGFLTSLYFIINVIVVEFKHPWFVKLIMILFTLAAFTYTGYYVYNNIYNSEKNIKIRKAKEAGEKEKEKQPEKDKQTIIIDDDPDWSSYYK